MNKRILVALAASGMICLTAAENTPKPEPKTGVIPAAPRSNPLGEVSLEITPSQNNQLALREQKMIDEIKERIRLNRRKVVEYEVLTRRHVLAINELFESYSKADRNFTGFSGLGRVEQMELKAELYANEKRARRQTTEAFTKLSDIIFEMEKTKKQIAEDRLTLNLRLKAANMLNQSGQLAKDRSGRVKKGTKAIELVEYFQVKTPADIRTISSYPEVYGSQDFWEYLYRANRDKIKDPDKPIPAGITLTVPLDAKNLPDFNDL